MCFFSISRIQFVSWERVIRKGTIAAVEDDRRATRSKGNEVEKDIAALAEARKKKGSSFALPLSLPALKGFRSTDSAVPPASACGSGSPFELWRVRKTKREVSGARAARRKQRQGQRRREMHDRRRQVFFLPSSTLDSLKPKKDDADEKKRRRLEREREAPPSIHAAGRPAAVLFALERVAVPASRRPGSGWPERKPW